MEEHKGVSDFFLGLIGVAVIGLLTAIMLFALLPLDRNDLALTDLNRPTEQTPNPPPKY